MSIYSQVGLGLNYLQGHRQTYVDEKSNIDFIELSPGKLCRERLVGGERRMIVQTKLLEDALIVTAPFEMVAHGLTPASGCACSWNLGYLEALDALAKTRALRWYSEHPGFMNIQGGGGQAMHAGMILPVPYTREAIDLISGRVRSMQQRYSIPFLLKNNLHFLDELPVETGLDEVGFFRELCRESGCGLLLDLHNLHCKAMTLNQDSYNLLEWMPLDRVVEIRVAGGSVHGGLLEDFRCREVPETVWCLLEWCLPRCTHLRGILLEVLEESLPNRDGCLVQEQMRRIRGLLAPKPKASLLFSGGWLTRESACMAMETRAPNLEPRSPLTG